MVVYILKQIMMMSLLIKSLNSYVEDMQDREALANLVTKQKWEPEALRKAVADSLPHISAKMTPELGMVIDSYAFTKRTNLSPIGIFNNSEGKPIEKKQIVSSLEGNVFSVDWVGAFSLKVHQINLEHFQSIEVSRYMELFSFINSQKWKGRALREALLEKFPDICSNLTIGMAITIDTLAFHNVNGFNRKEGFFWLEAYNFPSVGVPIDEVDGDYIINDDDDVVCWAGAFTFQIVDAYTFYERHENPRSYD
jgi:hypothetical protein